MLVMTLWLIDFQFLAIKSHSNYANTTDTVLNLGHDGFEFQMLKSIDMISFENMYIQSVPIYLSCKFGRFVI